MAGSDITVHTDSVSESVSQHSFWEFQLSQAVVIISQTNTNIYLNLYLMVKSQELNPLGPDPPISVLVSI